MELVVEPSAYETQFPVDGGFRCVQEFCCFFGCEAKEEAQLDHATFARIEFVELLEDAVEVQHLRGACVDPGEVFVERH